MRFDRIFASGLLGLALAFPVLADAPLKIIPLTINKHTVRVEVVQKDEDRMKGLMFREKLGKNDGMLFIFDDPGYHSMWMMNTLIPLSVAFVDRDGVILNVEDMEPKTTDSHMAAGPALYAIETNKGWFAERKIKPGDKVTGLPRH
jgi:uncharacterized membrane protein (UPF0127 family)